MTPTDEPYTRGQITSFVDLLKTELPDPRDNRGKRHSLAWVAASFVLATLVGRQSLSSIHRFIRNRVVWLGEMIQIQQPKPISRAHLPRLLAGLDWPTLNRLVERCFGLCIHSQGAQKWVAVDGKALRGTLDAGDKQNVIFAVTHDSREVAAQTPQCGGNSGNLQKVNGCIVLALGANDELNEFPTPGKHSKLPMTIVSVF